MNILISLLMLFVFTQPSTDKKATVSTTADAVTEVVIEGNDQMRFNLTEIKVKAGSTVKLTLKHVGKLPKQAMGHNWVLLNADVVVKDFAMSAMSARDNDYIPKDSKDVIVHTDLVGGGESTTIEFEAPAKGEYTFICSFPGHYGLMKGTFIVE
tara:strand:+ start:22088 stop:22549 length:462 start_codon:yes stop_codon:yes gene_type:complete